MSPESVRYDRELNESDKKYAEEFLNETEETRKDSLRQISEWAAENPKLRVKIEEKSLLTFLRGYKFNLEKTKEKLTNFYRMKRDIPEWFANRNPLLNEIQELVKLGVFVPLKFTNNNELVVIIRTAAHNPKTHKQSDVFKAGKMILDVALQESECAQIYGVTAIFDMKGITFGHARQLPPSVVKKSVYAWHNYCCRPKHLEFINAPMYINVILDVFKSFMSDKLKGRVQVHYKNYESLHKVVSPDILPKEYGGTAEELQELIDHWYKKLMDNIDWFAEDDKYKAERED